MDPSSFQLNTEDYAPFIPAALDGFELRPSKAHLIGRKTGNGYKFTYTLEWYQESEVEPSRQSRSTSRSKKSCRMTSSRSSSASTRRSTVDGLKGIIDENDGPYPLPFRVEEVDNKYYHIVDNENCRLQMEGNYEFNQLMRDEAIRQGLYYPTSFTPLRNGKVTEHDVKRKSKEAVIIREKYFKEWMKFRNEGARYNGLWKGLIVPKSDQSTLSSASHPHVDFLTESDWMNKYPNLWPMCQLLPPGESAILPTNSVDADWTSASCYDSEAEEDKRRQRRMRREKDTARQQWLTERKKEMDMLECLKQQRGSLSSSAATPRKGATIGTETYVQLVILLPNNVQAELLHRASRQDEVKPFLTSMLEGARLPELPPISDTINRLFYKTANGSKRRLHLDEGCRLDDVEMVENFWRLFVDCTK